MFHLFSFSFFFPLNVVAKLIFFPVFKYFIRFVYSVLEFLCNNIFKRMAQRAPEENALLFKTVRCKLKRKKKTLHLMEEVWGLHSYPRRIRRWFLFQQQHKVFPFFFFTPILKLSWCDPFLLLPSKNLGKRVNICFLGLEKATVI